MDAIDATIMDAVRKTFGHLLQADINFFVTSIRDGLTIQNGFVEPLKSSQTHNILIKITDKCGTEHDGVTTVESPDPDGSLTAIHPEAEILLNNVVQSLQNASLMQENAVA